MNKTTTTIKGIYINDFLLQIDKRSLEFQSYGLGLRIQRLEMREMGEDPTFDIRIRIIGPRMVVLLHLPHLRDDREIPPPRAQSRPP